MAREIPDADAGRVVDARGEKGLSPAPLIPMLTSASTVPLSEDAVSESASAATGGVTTICSYFRTGKNYLNKTGSFKEIFPELLEKSAESYRIDYAYHIACMSSEQIDEIEWLVREGGVSTL